METNYDVIVAGAGIAGALAATAAAQRGAKTLLIDRNYFETAGKKTNWGWVCGDAVAKAHLDFLHSELGIDFDSPELDTKVDGVYAISPDMKNKFLFEGEGYTLDRPKLAKKIVNMAKKAGAEYLEGHEVEGPILDGNKITGIFGKDEKKQEYKKYCKILIDCLGTASTLRRKLPVNDYISREVSVDDLESTGRYIMKFDSKYDDLNYYDPKNALIHLNQVLAPGGYGWVFPKSNHRINVGIGVEKHSLDRRNAKLGKSDSLHKLIDEYVEWNPVIANRQVDDTDSNGKGYWSVSVRRQQDSLVYMNYMGAGDSMSMANPISAGGIGPAMVSGVLAGEIAGEAIRENKISMEHLWKYNTKYNEVYGSKTAALEIFRVYLQSLNNDLINYGMEHFLTPKEAEELSYGRMPEISMAGKFQKLLSGIANINAFKNLLYTTQKMKLLIDLYKKYPKEMKDFAPWHNKVVAEMKDFKEKFPANPI